jgi:hypothetical protein
MMKLATIEWMKLKRSNTAKIILLVYAVVVPLMYWMLSLLNVGPIRIPDAGYQFPDAYQLTAWCASWFNLMVGVIIIVFTTNELKYKTQRQNAIDGLRKVDLILSKFIVIFGLTLLVTVYTFLVAFAAGLINGGGGGIFDGIEYIGVYFISTLGYFAFAFFFANLVRLPALAIIIYIFSTFIEGIVGFIAVQEYAQFFPLSTFSDLVPFPMHFFVQDVPNPYLMTTVQASLLALAYIGAFIASSYWIIKRRDI